VSEKLVLDSFALVSLFHHEPGWQVVQKVSTPKKSPVLARSSTGSIGANFSTSSSAASGSPKKWTRSACLNRALSRRPAARPSRSGNQKCPYSFLRRCLLCRDRTKTGSDRLNRRSGIRVYRTPCQDPLAEKITHSVSHQPECQSIPRDFMSRKKYLVSRPRSLAAAARFPSVLCRALTTNSFRAAFTPSR
jgi:hypothetical protein